jgi:hypothetical protein
VTFDDINTDEPLPQARARKLLSYILKNGTLVFSGHARREMVADGMDEQDVVNVLRGGRIHEPCEFEGGSWRYRCHTPRFCVVVAFDGATRTIIVTAWRKT